MEGAPTAAFSPEAARRARDRVLRPLAADLAGRARELSLALQERVRARAPELFPDPEAAEANRASAEATIRAMGELLSSGERAGEIELPPETAAYTRMGARAGIPAISLLRLYRLGQAALWELVLPELARRADDPEQLAVAVRGFSESTFDYIDAAAILAERVYTAERERFVRSAAAARAETVATLLGGRHVDAGLASRRLGYPLERTHVGAVAWVESGSDEALTMTQLEAAIDQLARRLGATSVLFQPVGLLAASAWLAVPAGLAPDALDSLRLDAEGAPGIRLGVGEPASGVPGFAVTHSEAQEARRVATLAAEAPGSVTRYGRVAVQALASVDADQARRLVRRRLGGLASEDETSTRLATTLRTYLEEQASRSRAARRLGVHENTVSYRIRQAEEILGRSVERDTLELHVALALAPLSRRTDG